MNIRLLKSKNSLFPIIMTWFLIMISCKEQSIVKAQDANKNLTKTSLQNASNDQQIIVGANRTKSYLRYLKGKSVGIVANQTSVIFKDGVKRENRGANTEPGDSNDTKYQVSYTHIVDSLIRLGVDIKRVFAPEHGFRGTADAGESIKNGLDAETGVPIISIYGKDKTLPLEKLADIDIMLFDIQDVGARFYTYISTLHYVMEACAEAKIPVLVFDRPNPNGHYIDGPILQMEHKSFVGMHPIPTVHGMTIGEYARMINGEQWLKNKLYCELIVIEMKHYKHDTFYSLPIKPSPNLPNDKAVNLYPSLCFFEGTNVSAGRGTSKQFQIYGSPYLSDAFYDYKFVPKPNHGSKYPKHEGKVCVGDNLSQSQYLDGIQLEFLISAYNNTTDKSKFFNTYFTKLAGTRELRQQIENGTSIEMIRQSWQPSLKAFKKIRKKYLMYD